MSDISKRPVMHGQKTHQGKANQIMIRHDAGTYREGDGRGGSSTNNQCFASLNIGPPMVT